MRPSRIVVFCFAVSGALAGMAGLFEVTGPAGQISIDFGQGYGFTAIIVAFLGRLNPIGILLAGLLMALTYVGGDNAATNVGLPVAAISAFQGMLLFFLLAVDVAVNYRLRWRRAARSRPVVAATGGGPMSSISPELLLASLMVASTPILLAALGELVVERAGVLNLGVEGMMIVGAVTGFMAATASGSPWLGFGAALAGGAALALVFAALTQGLMSNQVATGLALTLFGLGLASMLGQGWVGIKGPGLARLDLGPLSDIPVLGRILFRHDPIVYASLGLTLGVWAFLHRTRAGLVLRAVGESAEAAHALGYPVALIRTGAIAFGGALAGLGGAYLSIVRVPQWTDGLTAGAGWIALAIVVFASWRPGRALLGAYLFGGITVLQLNLQAAGARVPVELLSASPYLVTILVLVLISWRGRRGRSGDAPADLGRPFHAAR